ncbi:LytR family transcriptional regulator [Halobacillus andaensis]|uniref:LytR family transcriptional regulator n=1 Tax=Halobacillus andaensis TaxID=1176239 RepID=A0A917BAG1_HALAA|nr:LCP family protein [Halobacillus andaensis]MBP2005401.1 LCP family protein required for cell wall assembly [Halobacillus andaensis]GGF31189.1 LytR family transcriptional regulator [Halobacillus andaensis]
MKRRKLKIALWSLAFVLLLTVGATAGYAAFLTDKARDTADASHESLDRGDKSDKRDEIVTPDLNSTSVLFIGVDDSETRDSRDSGGRSLSDALVLATFNDEDKSVKLVSIPRDSYAYIPEVGYNDKITHAHAFGGTDATIETVENLLDVPVDYYVRLNFNSFVDVVNSINGVEFDVPFDLAEQNSEDTKNAIELEEGRQVVNGEEALALVRSRQYDSDLARGERQMEMIEAIVDKAASVGSISNYGNIIDSIGDNMKTNLTFSQMTSYKDYVLSEEGLNFDEMQLEGEGGYKDDGIWYFQIDENSLMNIQSTLRAHLDLEEQSEPSSFAGEEQNSSDTDHDEEYRY